MDGFEVATSSASSWKEVQSIVILTARTQRLIKVKGLDTGG